MTTFGDFNLPAGTVRTRTWVYDRLENVLAKMSRHHPGWAFQLLRHKVSKHAYPDYPIDTTLADIRTWVRRGDYDNDAIKFYDDVMEIFEATITWFGKNRELAASIVSLEAKFVEWCRAELDVWSFDDPPDRSGLFPPKKTPATKRAPAATAAPTVPAAAAAAGPSAPPPPKKPKPDVSSWRVQISDALDRGAGSYEFLKKLVNIPKTHSKIDDALIARFTSDISSVSDKDVMTFHAALVDAGMLEK